MNPITDNLVNDVINVDELLARCMGNIDIAERILSKFQTCFSVDLTELEKGVDEHDVSSITLLAHRLKGASANVSAPALYELASEIEKLGRADRISEIPPGVQQLRTEWTRFVNGVSMLELSQCQSR